MKYIKPALFVTSFLFLETSHAADNKMTQMTTASSLSQITPPSESTSTTPREDPVWINVINESQFRIPVTLELFFSYVTLNSNQKSKNLRLRRALY